MPGGMVTGRIEPCISSTFIPVRAHLLITQACQILNDLRLEVEAKLFYEQRIPDNPWWINFSTSQLVNKHFY